MAAGWLSVVVAAFAVPRYEVGHAVDACGDSLAYGLVHKYGSGGGYV